jgi:diguanylate cyclase (GGDEF)-like protein
VPIRLGARRGILTIDRYGGRHFQRDDLETVQLFATIAAVALENASLYRIAEQQAISDGLTGLYNHRHFYERLGMELTRARRSGEPLALLMIDLDDFKQLNDAHGHPAGDEVLRTVGRILAEETRRGVDLAARYGGEEFAVFLPNTAVMAAGAPGKGAAAVAERLRSTIAQAPIEHGEGDAKLTLHITVSIGLAVYPATASTMGELVAQADAALYLAKRRGKDRVEIYGLKR